MINKEEFDYTYFPYVKIAIDAWTYFFANPNVIPPKNVKELEEKFIKWLNQNEIELNKKMTRNIRLIITPNRMRKRQSIILKGDMDMKRRQKGDKKKKAREDVREDKKAVKKKY